MKRRIRMWKAFCRIVVLAFLSSGYAAQATTFDVAADFSATNNPNGVWSYGWSSTLTSAFSLYPNHCKDPIIPVDVWAGSNCPYSPNVSHNGTGSPIHHPTIIWQPGQFSLHPGDNGEYSHVRWTAPDAGIFDIAAMFTGIDHGGTSPFPGTTTDVHVLHNSISLFEGEVNGFNDTASFSTTVSVGMDDIIDFAVGYGYGSNPTHTCDTTALSVTITPICEPAVPVAYWSFDDAGDPGHDDSGNGHDGYVNGAVPSDGICGKALSFDGQNDYVGLPSSSSLSFNTPSEAFSASFWIKPDTTIPIEQTILENEDDYLISLYGAGLSYRKTDSGNLYHNCWHSYLEISTETWSHIAMTYDGTGAGGTKMYVNGEEVPVTNTAYHGGGSASGDDFAIGIRAFDFASAPYEGEIDEVRIYDRALSPCEIKELTTPCEPAVPDIEVSPLIYDFGDVELGTSSTVIVTISNVGTGDLNVSGIALETDFAITSVPPASVVVEPSETVDVEITYTPTVLGDNSAVLKITSDDPDEPVVEVQLSAAGVEIPPPPSEQIANILAFFNTSVDDGSLVGDGPGSSAEKRLNALRNMVEAAGSLIDDELSEEACQQLLDVYRRMDGQPSPPDFVKGEAVPELAAMIQELMTSLGCE